MGSARIAAAALLALTVTAATAWAGALPGTVTIGCAPVEAARGSTAAVQISLSHPDDTQVAGVQNDLEFDAAVFSITPDRCVINPAIGAGTPADKRLNTSVIPLPPETPTMVRNIVVGLESSNPIPNGVLYTCTFDVAAGAALGDYTLTNGHLVAADPNGDPLPVEGTNCAITVKEATPTPTPIGFCENDDDCPPGEVCVDHHCLTPTPTPTPIGFCNDNSDCPEGQVCVDHRCVTPTPTPIGFCEDNTDCPPGQVCVDHRCVTPTPTPTPIGFCNSNDDCPVGQVCVDHMCVTPTPKKKGGGGGCSCKVDPRESASSATDTLALLLPLLVLLLRWRAWRPTR